MMKTRIAIGLQYAGEDLSLYCPLRYQHTGRASAQNLYEKSMIQETSVTSVRRILTWKVR